jgi:serine/threonine-protein kinase
VQTKFSESNADISPNGRWFAYQSQESGRDEVYVRPFPNVADGRWQVSVAGGREPLWSRDGRELFYVSPEDVLMGVQIETGEAWRATSPVPILTGRYLYTSPTFGPGRGGSIGRSFDISPDGRRFLMMKVEAGENAVPTIVVVQNWHEELKRLVPAN